jgi:hypothetical protein
MELAHATDTNRKSGNPGAGLPTVERMGHGRVTVRMSASRVVVQTSGWCSSKAW